jgi:hypothetical protein
MWRRIASEMSAVWTNAEMTDLETRITAARKRGSTAEANRLIDERQNMGDTLRHEKLAKMKSDPALDPKLVELKGELTDLNYTNRTERVLLLQQVAKKLGEPGESRNPTAPDYGTTSGFARRHGLLLEISWATMDDPSVGMPALAAWLCDQHCAGMRYEIMAGYDESDD